MVEVVRPGNGTGIVTKKKPGVDERTAALLGGVVEVQTPPPPPPIDIRDPNLIYEMSVAAMKLADAKVLSQIDSLDEVLITMPKIDDISIIRDADGKKTGYTVMTVDGNYTMDRIGASPAKLVLVGEDPIATATRGYTPVQNKSVALKTYEVLLESDMPVKKFSARNVGGRNANKVAPHRLAFHGQFDIAGRFEMEGASEAQLVDFGEDIFETALKVTNSYNMTSGLWAMVQTKRLICLNMAVRNMTAFSEHIVHRSANEDQMEVLDRTADVIRKAEGAMTDLYQDIRGMRETPFDKESAKWLLDSLKLRQYEAEYIEDYGGIRVNHEPELEIVTMGNVATQWDMVNVITDLANHVKTDSRAFDLQRFALDRVLVAAQTTGLHQVHTGHLRED